MQNEMELRFQSLSGNEGFARAVAAAFASQLNPSIEELSDIRTAVSEAVTTRLPTTDTRARRNRTSRCSRL